MKRAVDIVGALIGLLLTWPLWVLAAIAIRLDSPGPVFFTQTRMGRDRRPFLIYKFRTMTADAPSKGGQLTIGQDARVTGVGAVLRQYKIDELPQLWNILTGDMSLVGPRPEVPRYVNMFPEAYTDILAARPGLTDLASLKYIDEAAVLAASDSPEEEYVTVVLPEKIRLARFYVQHASTILDLAIVIQTLLCLLKIPVVVCDLPDLQVARPSQATDFGPRCLAFILKWRRPLIVLLDMGLMALANYLAFWLRFDGRIPEAEWGTFLLILPWVLAIRTVAFIMFRLNEGLWRYTSLWDLRNIVVGVVSSTLVLYAWTRWGMGVREYPRSIFIIDAILLISFSAGVRLPRRILREAVIYRPKKTVLIIGAGDRGERVVREMKLNANSRYQPIGFIDDHASLRFKRIHGVKVLGSREDLPYVLSTERPDEVILALPQITPDVLRQIMADLGPFRVSVKMLPSMQDLLGDRSAVSQIRNVAVEDLLARAPVHMKTDAMVEMVTGRRVLITGAGGSIGSELSRQIASMGPESVVLYERHENSLYTIAKELDDRGVSTIVHPVLGDVTDRRRLMETMTRYRPAIVFHAAAHKHVPLVELNPAEALKNNCIGTRITAETADRCGVERFVLISTDKAVNPSSVMGATKRAAELIVQDMAERSATRFLTVRFGNVLGSNGSVLLRFQEQIQAGGPVTVTHPDIRRYFMLIPEAVHLVLQAATLGEQGATYVLDMGEQIKVLDLARNLIRLSGFVPGREIPIRFVGLRPGEKLYEELIGTDEVAELSTLSKILRIRRSGMTNVSKVSGMMMAMEAAAYLNNPEKAIERLRELVTDFRPPEKIEDPGILGTEWTEDEPAYSGPGR
ncbi:MAG TPA: SDR family NAD(P)-dependent oxidoreductase [Nitrospira sp.]|nr:SDR family NAD(P)-dependent oxidoreductase [Nitrospira sp.]